MCAVDSPERRVREERVPRERRRRQASRSADAPLTIGGDESRRALPQLSHSALDEALVALVQVSIRVAIAVRIRVCRIAGGRAQEEARGGAGGSGSGRSRS